VDAEESVRRKWRLLKATMDERAQRLWAGTEAGAIGHGGVAAVVRATGLAIIDGFKRVRAARALGWSTLLARISHSPRSRPSGRRGRRSPTRM